MKRLFNKRWHRLPVALVVAILVLALTAGGVFAAYTVFTSTTEVTVLEPLEVTEIQAVGQFWDWGNPEEPVQPVEIYAGMDLGAAGYGGKYLIHNLMPSENARGMPIVLSVKVTVTIEETTGQMEWCGLKGVYSTTTHEATSTCNYAVPIVDLTSNEDCWSVDLSSECKSCTFELGTKDYPIGTASADILEDSNSVVFFVDGVVASDAAPNTSPLNFIVTVERG